MKLRRMVLHSFGRYREAAVDLAPGLNVLFGSNGAGKSTLIQFLLWMLYDPENRKRGIRERIRERFRPWDGSALWGELEFDFEGVPYRMERFYDTAAKKRFAVFHGITGADVTAQFLPTPGEVLFGFGQEAFLRTFFVGQLSTPFEKEGKEDELMAALMNLSSSGNEAVSAQKALKALEDASRKLQLKTGRGGKIGVAEETIDRLSGLLADRRRREADLHLKAKRLEQVTALVEEQKRAKAAAKAAAGQKRKEQLAALDAEAEALVKELERTDAMLEGVAADRLSDAEEACRVRKSTAERRAQITAEADDLRLRQARQEEQARMTEEEAARRAGTRRLLCTLFGALLLAVALLGLLSRRIWWAALLPPAVLGILLLVLAFLPKKQNIQPPADEFAPRLAQLAAETAGLDSREKTAEETLRAVFGRDVLEDEVRLVAARVGERKIKQLQYEELQKRRALLTAASDIDLPEAPAEPYDGPAFDEARFRALLTELGSLSAELEAGFSGLPPEHTLTEQLRAEEETLTRLCQNRDALKLAQDLIVEIAEQMQHSFGPRLNQAAAEILSRLTGGAVSGVRVSGDYKMELTDANGSHALDFFSNGTVDQAYLSLRLGILDLLQKKGDGPLLLDDVFCQYDDARLASGLAFLAERAEGQQILYCTCRREEYPAAAQLINLDGLF